MGDEASMISEQPNATSEGPVGSAATHLVAASSSATAVFANNPQNQYILLRKQPMTSADPQMAQTTLTRLPLQCAPSSISSAQPQIRAQNVSIMQNPMFQKMAVNRPILTLNRQGLIPVQVSQGHTIILNSIAQSSSVKHPILPKGASPEKITTQSNLKPVYVPLSSTLTVRPIAPRSGTSVAAGGDNDKKKPQHQFVPKMIAPQPARQLIIPAQVGQGGTVSFSRQNNLNSSSIQNLSNNVVRLQGPSGQIMQAVITPVQISGVTPGAMLVGSNSKVNRNGDDPMNGEEIRVETKPVKKPCNCTKSQCLKLYCDCFANGEFCSNCNCQNCSNNIEHEIERSKAIKACLERNPSAFHPKIGKTRGIAERRHTKGCHCRRSGCLKNYCECYEAKIMCSSLCKCTGCKNFEESPERKTLMHLADAAEVRVLQQNAARSKLDTQLEAATTKPLSETIEKRLPFTFITSSVTSATCECLMARAEESEIKKLSEQKAERLIIDEFERSLLQIIQMANKSKDYHV